MKSIHQLMQEAKARRAVTTEALRNPERLAFLARIYALSPHAKEPKPVVRVMIVKFNE